MLFASAIASSPDGLGARAPGVQPAAVMTDRRPERITLVHRLRTTREYAKVKRDGRAVKGKHCMLLAAVDPGAPTRVGFIASRKGVGGAVQRNRARRRLREIVRRRWPRIVLDGHMLAFIAYRSVLVAPHPELAAEVERLLGAAGALEAASA